MSKNQNMTSSSKMLRTMAGIGVLCGLLIVLTYEGTYPRIQQLKAEALQQAIFNVLPGTSQVKAFAYENESFVEAPDNAEDVVYAGYNENGQLTGLAIQAQKQGYADVIKILYGYDPDKEQVVGFHVLESKETPGLGDQIEKNQNWLANFEALDVSLNDDKTAMVNEIQYVKSGGKENPWEVDGITGATISSRAIADMLRKSTATWIPRIYNNLEDFNLE